MTAPSRRSLLSGGLALAIAGPAAPALAAEEPPGEAFLAARDAVLEGRTPVAGAVTFDMPKLAENGLWVPMKVAVESPMSERDHIRLIHILSERNPIATVARFHLGPRSGRAEVETEIRLATSQRVWALAETADGRVLAGSAEVVVTLAACIEGG